MTATQGAGPGRGLRVVQLAAGALLGASALLVLVSVLFRYALGRPIAWSEEAARALLVWLAFTGAAIAFAEGRHIRLGALEARLGPRGRAVLALASDLVALLVLGALALDAARLTIARGDRPSPLLPAPYALFALPAAAGLGLCLVAVGARLPARLRAAGARGAAGAGLGAAAAAFAAISLLPSGPPGLALGVAFSAAVAAGLPIALALAGAALVVLAADPSLAAGVAAQRLVSGLDSYVLLALPLFVFAGALMEATGISHRIVDLALAAIGRRRGGLGHVTVASELLFSGISGSATADVAAVGAVMIPAMRRARYPAGEAASIVAAAAAMGILIPPSVHMVVLGTLVTVSVARLFLAGILPALLMAAGLFLLVRLRARRTDWDTADAAVGPPPSLREAARRAALPLLTPAVIFGGIFTGATTVTESAVLAVAYALLLGAGVYRRLTWAQLVALLVDSAALSGVALLLVATATLFGWTMVMQRLPHALGELLGPLAAHPALFLAVAIAIYLVFSGLLEGLPALLIFAPVLQPLANRAGIDPVHFGVVSIAALGIGFFLPPAGLGLSLSCTLANAGMGETMRRFWPYVLVLVAGLLLIAWVPAIALALPKAVLP